MANENLEKKKALEIALRTNRKTVWKRFCNEIGRI